MDGKAHLCDTRLNKEPFLRNCNRFDVQSYNTTDFFSLINQEPSTIQIGSRLSLDHG